MDFGKIHVGFQQKQKFLIKYFIPGQGEQKMDLVQLPEQAVPLWDIAPNETDPSSQTAETGDYFYTPQVFWLASSSPGTAVQQDSLCWVHRHRELQSVLVAKAGHAKSLINKTVSKMVTVPMICFVRNAEIP